MSNMKRRANQNGLHQSRVVRKSLSFHKLQPKEQSIDLRRNNSDDDISLVDSEGDARDGKETSTSNSEEESSDTDIDGPRIAQWDGGDEDENPCSDNVHEDKGEGPSERTEEPKAGDEITSLSFGSLLKARRILDRAHAENDSDSDSEVDGSEGDGKTDERHDDSQAVLRERPDTKKTGKRPHKHAPAEMSSKRPVTRRRQVVEVKKVDHRDPRFASVASDDDKQAFQKRYSFLVDLHESELETLRENLRRAQKMLRSAPRDRRKEWEVEVEKLERACKRTESTVNRDRKEAIERQALEKARKEEREQRKIGKSQWYMKKSARKELLLKARHDALAANGGRLAVRKAIEKRQKKISQKEKRRRPSFLGHDRDTAERGSSKRRKAAAQ